MQTQTFHHLSFMGADRACSAEVTLDHCPKKERDARLPSANVVDVDAHSLIGPEDVLPSHCNVNEAEKVSAMQKNCIPKGRDCDGKQDEKNVRGK
jgi:hypothetical protein